MTLKSWPLSFVLLLSSTSWSAEPPVATTLPFTPEASVEFARLLIRARAEFGTLLTTQGVWPTEASIDDARCKAVIIKPAHLDAPLTDNANRIECAVETDENPITLTLSLKGAPMSSFGTRAHHEGASFAEGPTAALFFALKASAMSSSGSPLFSETVACDPNENFCTESYVLNQDANVPGLSYFPLQISCSRDSRLTRALKAPIERPAEGTSPAAVMHAWIEGTFKEGSRQSKPLDCTILPGQL